MYIKPNIDELRCRRVEKNLSQHKLSRMAGLGGNAINNIETGTTLAIHPLRAKVIAEALQCEVSDIFIDEKEMSA